MTDSPQIQVPEPAREFRAVWVATVDNIDWPTKPGLSTEIQRQELMRIVERVDELRMNAIIFQIRPHADAMYRSKLEPWSWYLTGEQGKGPDPEWDPLETMVAECHKRGIELHVWFNPYRANHPKQTGPMTPDHIANTNPEVVYKYGGYRWMDPGSKLVQDRSFDVFLDVVKRYDIDGVHIDDYFYPYPVRENGQKVEFPDEGTYGQYVQAGGKLGRSDWRRKNVDDFIKRVYFGIKSEKPWVKFGISPFGIYRPGYPAGITAGIDQYEDLSADALKWFKEGWCDYFTPQLYWPIEQEKQSFPKLLNWWRSVNPKGRHLWPGMYTGQVDPKGANWDVNQVVRQIRLTREDHPGVPGHVHFSMKSLLYNWKDVGETLKSQMYKERALMPASPWLSTKKVAAPVVDVSADGSSWSIELATSMSGNRFYAIQTQDEQGEWRLHDVTSVSVHAFPASVKTVAVAAVDRFGTLGDWTVARRPLAVERS